MIRKSLDGWLCTYMHDAGYTRSRLVSWIHMYNGDEQEVREGGENRGAEAAAAQRFQVRIESSRG